MYFLPGEHLQVGLELRNVKRAASPNINRLCQDQGNTLVIRVSEGRRLDLGRLKEEILGHQQPEYLGLVNTIMKAVKNLDLTLPKSQ